MSAISIDITVPELLAIIGWGFSALLLLIAYLLRTRLETIETLHAKDVSELKVNLATHQRDQETWKLENVKSHAEMVGTLRLLQENYSIAIETIKSDLRDIKQKTDSIPVMDNRLRQVENMMKGDRNGGHSGTR